MIGLFSHGPIMEYWSAHAQSIDSTASAFDSPHHHPIGP